MKREELYHSFLNNMYSGFALLEIINVGSDKYDFIFLDSNKAFFDCFGLVRGEILHQSIGLFFGRLFSNLESFLHRIVNLGTAAIYEAKSLNANKIFEVRAYPFEKKFIALQIIDITKQKKIEKAYTEIEADNLTLANKSPISIMTFDENGIVNFANDYLFTEFLGGKFAKDDILGKHFSRLGFCKEDYCREIAKVLDNRLVELRDIDISVNGSGNRIFCNVRAVPLVHQDKLSGGIIIIEDISLLKHAKQELSQKSNEQELLLDNADSLIWFMQTPRKIGTVNYAFADFFGVDKNFPKNKEMSDILPFHEADGLVDIFSKVWASKYPQYFDKFIFNKAGNKRLLRIKVTPKLNAKLDVELLACSATDITEQRRNEEEMKNLIVALKLSNRLTDERATDIIELNRQLIQSESKLKDSLASKDKFFSIIAHDLMSPFQGFLSLTKYLSTNIEELEVKDIQDLALALNKSATDLHKLLENLLNWSRIQRSTIQYTPEYIDLSQAVDMNINLAIHKANSKRINLLNTIPEKTIVYSDLNLINTIIRNLISNALKFTNYGGEIKVGHTHTSNNFIEFYVQDNGVGMDQQTLEKLFKIDEYNSTLGTANETGTGLGLVLCREFSIINKGSIRVESSLGVGTTFFVTVPTKEI